MQKPVDKIPPEKIQAGLALLAKQELCQQTNLSYYQNVPVHCTRPASHVIDGEEHWGTETDGTERGWDL